MKVKLEQNILEYLQKVLVKDNPNLAKFLEQNQEDGVFDVDDDVAEEIYDWAGERLEVFGFDEGYKPTEEGKILKTIIDLFNKE